MVFYYEHCPRSFPSRSLLTDHLMVHNKEKVRCSRPNCGREYTNYANLRRHIRTTHKIEDFCKEIVAKRKEEMTRSQDAPNKEK